MVNKVFVDNERQNTATITGGKISGYEMKSLTRQNLPKAPNHEILGAQHLSLYEIFPVAQRQKLVAYGTQAPLEHSPEIQMFFWIQSSHFKILDSISLET